MITALSNREFLLSILGIAVFGSFFSKLLINYAASRVSAFIMASFGALTTLVSMFLGIVMLKEPVTPAFLIGAAMIIIGIRQVIKPA